MRPGVPFQHSNILPFVGCPSMDPKMMIYLQRHHFLYEVGLGCCFYSLAVLMSYVKPKCCVAYSVDYALNQLTFSIL